MPNGPGSWKRFSSNGALTFVLSSIVVLLIGTMIARIIDLTRDLQRLELQMVSISDISHGCSDVTCEKIEGFYRVSASKVEYLSGNLKELKTEDINLQKQINEIQAKLFGGRR